MRQKMSSTVHAYIYRVANDPIFWLKDHDMAVRSIKGHTDKMSIFSAVNDIYLENAKLFMTNVLRRMLDLILRKLVHINAILDAHRLLGTN